MSISILGEYYFFTRFTCRHMTVFYWMTCERRACKTGARSTVGNKIRNGKELKDICDETGTE